MAVLRAIAKHCNPAVAAIVLLIAEGDILEARVRAAEEHRQYLQENARGYPDPVWAWARVKNLERLIAARERLAAQRHQRTGGFPQLDRVPPRCDRRREPRSRRIGSRRAARGARAPSGSEPPGDDADAARGRRRVDAVRVGHLRSMEARVSVTRRRVGLRRLDVLRRLDAACGCFAVGDIETGVAIVEDLRRELERHVRRVLRGRDRRAS
jgi:hypothetical protein